MYFIKMYNMYNTLRFCRAMHTKGFTLIFSKLFTIATCYLLSIIQTIFKTKSKARN